ncbi:MAG: mandelate racemase [Proteobacteria bacterium]|nr:mandelate racemase [Pseudomonadota bacterium]
MMTPPRQQGARIRSIQARGVDLSLGQAVETASGTMNTQPIVLIDLTTDEGVVGRSYLRCYTPLALGALTRLVGTLQQVLEDTPAAPFDVQQRLQRAFRLVGDQGLVGLAIAGIDMALWDALAKGCGVPLIVLLGGVRKPIPAYACLRNMSPGAAADEAMGHLEQGFTAIKFKVGRGDVAADLEMIRTLRRSVGDRVKLMVDYNQSLSVAQAIDRLRVLEGEGLYWVEEPTRADDYEGHARIAAAFKTSIQLGENWSGPHEMAKSIRVRASDYATLDVMKMGGVSGWLAGAAQAQAAGLPVSSHSFAEFSAHLLAATPTAHYLEYLDHVGPILKRPIPVEDGRALIPDCPGVGLEWDEEAVSRLCV